MRIAIYGKPTANSLNSSLSALLKRMQEKGFGFAFYERYADFLYRTGILTEEVAIFNRDNINISDFTFLLSVGGDGTLLDTATLVGASGVPVIGINAGRLGFISGAGIEEIEGVMDSFIDGSVRFESRSLLQLKSERNHFVPNNYALNELTVLKKDSAAMVRIDVTINDELLNSYLADGLIVSTPTGSTAYSLSCGGPIIIPGSENFVITPIAPHNLNVRPVVVSNSARIGITVSGRSDDFLIALDSTQGSFGKGELLEVTKAPFYLKIIQPEGHSFLNTLRNKLAWGYDKRN